ncbi:MAG: hypothetical protein OXI25_08440 [Chloroflexota bacterium]|nr:hypothetical protein [Chloroflexota bacterium]
MSASEQPLPAEVQAALASHFFIRTTFRRRDGRPRTIQTTFVWDGERRIYLSGYPGKRDWVASIAANAEVTVDTVESGAWYAIAGEARVLRERKERMPHLLAFVEHWAARARPLRFGLRPALLALRVNRRLGLPWWGPFYCARRVLDRMPCVEVRLVGEPWRRPDGPPRPSEPGHDYPL